jgi:hypothetical protein
VRTLHPQFLHLWRRAAISRTSCCSLLVPRPIFGATSGWILFLEILSAFCFLPSKTHWVDRPPLDPKSFNFCGTTLRCVAVVKVCRSEVVASTDRNFRPGCCWCWQRNALNADNPTIVRCDPTLQAVSASRRGVVESDAVVQVGRVCDVASAAVQDSHAVVFLAVAIY